MARYGGQFDGSYVAASYSGPTPPTPSAPTITPTNGGLAVRWDGEFTDALYAPMDFGRVEVHAADVAFNPLVTPHLLATFETPRGSVALLSLPAVPQFVSLVCVSLSGKFSAGSAQVSGTPMDAASIVDLFDALALAEAYTDVRLVDAEAYTDARLIDAEAYADARLVDAEAYTDTAVANALTVLTLPVYANNAAAITGGLAVGSLYRNGSDPDLVCVVH